jgi:hypothetical protein
MSRAVDEKAAENEEESDGMIDVMGMASVLRSWTAILDILAAKPEGSQAARINATMITDRGLFDQLRDRMAIATLTEPIVLGNNTFKRRLWRDYWTFVNVVLPQTAEAAIRLPDDLVLDAVMECSLEIKANPSDPNLPELCERVVTMLTRSRRPANIVMLLSTAHTYKAIQVHDRILLAARKLAADDGLDAVKEMLAAYRALETVDAGVTGGIVPWVPVQNSSFEPGLRPQTLFYLSLANVRLAIPPQPNYSLTRPWTGP